MKKRESWIDIAKGIAIILVVFGHSTFLEHNEQNKLIDYVYWFHMPAFFIISGYFFRPTYTWAEFRHLVIKRGKQLLLPYFTFLIFFTLFRYGIEIVKGNMNINWYIKDFAIVIFGGRFIGGVYSVFWFITTLFTTQLLLSFIMIIIRTKKYQIFTIIILYFLAHVETLLLFKFNIDSTEFKIPWNLDVSLICLIYLSIGFYFKEKIFNIPKNITFASLLLAGLLILVDYSGIYYYHLDLKLLYYNSLFLDLFIPIIFTFSLLGISQLLSNMKFNEIFVFLGSLSLFIMYLHIPVNLILSKFFRYGELTYTILGILIPVIISEFIFRNMSIRKKLLLGLTISSKKNNIKKANASA